MFFLEFYVILVCCSCKYLFVNECVYFEDRKRIEDNLYGEKSEIKDGFFGDKMLSIGNWEVIEYRVFKRYCRYDEWKLKLGEYVENKVLKLYLIC